MHLITATLGYEFTKEIKSLCEAKLAPLKLEDDLQLGVLVSGNSVYIFLNSVRLKHAGSHELFVSYISLICCLQSVGN